MHYLAFLAEKNSPSLLSLPEDMARMDKGSAGMIHSP